MGRKHDWLEDGRDEGGKFKADFDCFRLLAAFLEAPKINKEKPMASLAIYIYRSTSGFRGLCAFLMNRLDPSFTMSALLLRRRKTDEAMEAVSGDGAI